MTQADIDALVAKLREVKQRMFNEMVEGNGRQPAEVVDMVVYVLMDGMPDASARLSSEVVNFYPDYTG